MTRTVCDETGPSVRLICGTLATIEAEDRGGEAIAALLGVQAPTVWPPEHNDKATRDWLRSLLTDHPQDPDYACWYIIGQGRLVGVIGFKGPPDAEGQVEIGYAIIEPEHRKGYGLEAARLLVARAFGDHRVHCVKAETLPHLTASQKVLLRCGFTHVGGTFDPVEGQIMRFERRRGEGERPPAGAGLV
jgi:RimJ/RimL family protein N-acetyltransferase